MGKDHCLKIDGWMDALCPKPNLYVVRVRYRKHESLTKERRVNNGVRRQPSGVLWKPDTRLGVPFNSS